MFLCVMYYLGYQEGGFEFFLYPRAYIAHSNITHKIAFIWRARERTFHFYHKYQSKKKFSFHVCMKAVKMEYTQKRADKKEHTYSGNDKALSLIVNCVKLVSFYTAFSENAIYSLFPTRERAKFYTKKKWIENKLLKCERDKMHLVENWKKRHQQNITWLKVTNNNER